MQALQSQTVGTVYAEEGLRRQVRILPVYHHKLILVSDTHQYVSLSDHTEREPVEEPIQYS